MPHRVLHVKEVAFPTATESMLHQLYELSAMTFMPDWSLKHLIRIIAVHIVPNDLKM